MPEQTGLLAPPQNEKAFADAIDRILLDSVYRDKLAQAARKRVETKFSWEGVAAQLSTLYTELEQAAPVAKPTPVTA